MSINRGMDKEDMVHRHSEILLSPLKECNNAICNNMDELRECNIEWRKSDREEVLYNIPYVWNVKINNTNKLTYNSERESQT